MPSWVDRRDACLAAPLPRATSLLQNTSQDIGAAMPEISRFLGIVIAMYYNDHAPAHFHARYGNFEIRVDIETSEIISGEFPGRAQALVLEWLALNRNAIMLDWQLAKQRKPLHKIAPLE